MFEELTPQDLSKLSPLLDIQAFARGQFLFHAGDKADRLYFVQKGMVKVNLLSPQGEERILDMFRPGDTFGELFLTAAKTRMYSAQALSDVVVWTMTEEAFKGFMQSRPDLCLNLVRHLIAHHRRTLARMGALMHAQAGPRLLAMLLDLGERIGLRTDESYTLPARLTQGFLARMTGLHRSTISAIVSDYRRRRILGGRRGRMVIWYRRAVALLREAGIVLP